MHNKYIHGKAKYHSLLEKTMKEDRNLKKQIIVAVSVAAGILTALVLTAVLAFETLSRAQKNEAERYLDEVTEQYRNTMIKQIEGNLQTLEALATIIGNNIMDMDKVMDILETENYQNDFIRMGFVKPDGRGDLVDMQGVRVENVYLGEEAFIREALAGSSSVSDTLPDNFGEGYVNCYAVPVYKNGELIGALTAANSSETFAEIINQPIFSGNAYLHIINEQGDFIIRSAHQILEEGDIRSIFESAILGISDKEEILPKLQEGAKFFSQFTYNKIKYWMFFTPIGKNGWYILCMVPRSALNANFVKMTRMIICIFAVIILLLVLLFSYIYIIIRGSRNAMQRMAYYDQLTGLYNKARFMELASAKLEKDSNYALVLLDIANFKFVNELFGYQKGDYLLQHVANTCNRMLQEEEFCCRDNSDRFALLLHYSGKEVLTDRLKQLVDTIASCQLDDVQEYHILCNCGVKIIESFSNKINVDVFWDRANLALKNAKGYHDSTTVFYGDGLHDKEVKRNEIEQCMHAALDNREFKMYLQPKVLLNTSAVCGAEALVRWIRPDGSLIYPDEFIPVFEQNGFITDLDMYMLEEACVFLNRLEKNGYADICISVNQSRILFYKADYLNEIQRIIHKYHCDPSRIILEVTEGITMDNLDEMKVLVRELHKMGFAVSMDDFGSGYSSLNILKELDIDELKLDRVFLSDTAEKEKRDIIMKNIITLARELQITTVTEGVEDAAQAEFIHSIHCDIGQGYYFAKPMPEDAFELFIAGKTEE